MSAPPHPSGDYLGIFMMRRCEGLWGGVEIDDLGFFWVRIFWVDVFGYKDLAGSVCMCASGF